jgi:hypothetical protein
MAEKLAKTPLELDWYRKPSSNWELKLAAPAFRKCLAFLQAMESLGDKYQGSENGRKFHNSLLPLILNLWDAYLTGRPVMATNREAAKEFAHSIGADWPYCTNTISALQGNGFIESEGMWEDQEGISFNYSFYATGELLLNFEDLKTEVLEYSQPLDIHKWSNFPEVNIFIDQIYEQHFKNGNEKIRKKHIKVLLLDLYVRWTIDPLLKTAFSRNVNNYDPDSRYNAIHISKLTIDIVNHLESVGLIYQARGFKDRQSGIGRTSRIWPAPSLIRMFREAKFGPEHIFDHPDREVIILRDIDPETDKAVDVDYDETDETRRMREELRAYNNLIASSFIDIPTLEEPFIDVHANDEGGPQRIWINQHDKLTRRIFNRGSFEQGGRFYGGWWQRCPKKWREDIFINDQPISEVDFSGLHIVMLYAREGIDYWQEVNEDPYKIDLPFLEYNSERKRTICKQLALVALNARDDAKTFQAFRSDAPTGSEEKRMSNEILDRILNSLRERHKPIAGYFARDAGIELMNLDSQICGFIIEYYTEQLIPVLTIHDSFLVPFGLEGDLGETMERAFKEIMGINGVKWKEVTENPWYREPLSEEDGDSRHWEMILKARTNPQRSKRYLRELKAFKESMGVTELPQW